MALTRSFRDTVHARAERDPAYRDALLREGVEALLGGDVDTGKAILRDYVDATIGFGPDGNPTAKNLMAVIGELQRASGLSLHVRV
jgi:hypothetical protein